MEKLLEIIQEELLEHLVLESVEPEDPIEVRSVPRPWVLLGSGNYAAVLFHPEYEDYAVKIYAPGRPGLQEEVEVYRRLGSHPAYSLLYYAGPNFLLLKRLRGVTFYNCMKRGIPITDQAVRDIDEALEYAVSRGLHPHDVHAKNVMLGDGRGLIVDISDFLKQEDCTMWSDFKKAYSRLYRPVASLGVFPVPDKVLEAVRKGYRLWRRRRS
ncbi:serine/threonine protein kinase [Paenibacillus sp. 7124]|uniref:Serine/threonine protein kinase n=1 Tax=Paenibacillus apii TaxID=1850370 RepID=A0A6M1PLS8_9BACL|nr:serine/threonine protein kinase [Paenibacillus apii]NGM84607.1 serine/threonine protein kinase [Paenibacillus apii]NJJ40274.1 serine/threonine protein kinase [Paenibacillus apii]